MKQVTGRAFELRRRIMAIICWFMCIIAAGGVYGMGDREDGWARIRERAQSLEKDISLFNLQLWPNVPSDKPFYTVELTCHSVSGTDRSNPFVQLVHISTNEAKMLVEYLGKSGFLAGAQPYGSGTKRTESLGEGYWLAVRSGDGQSLGYRLNLGWNLNAIRSIEAVGAVVKGNGDAAKAFDLLLGRLSGLKRTWEEETTRRATINAEKTKAERDALQTNPPSVSLTDSGRVLTATLNGRTAWSVRLQEQAVRIELVGSDRIVVYPGKWAYDRLTGETLGKFR